MVWIWNALNSYNKSTCRYPITNKGFRPPEQTAGPYTPNILLKENKDLKDNKDIGKSIQDLIISNTLPIPF